MLDSFLLNIENNINLYGVLICIVISIVLGFVIAFTHKFTSRASKNFLITLTILPLVTQLIILLINNNLGMSIAIAGTFSLVRFRSMPGTSKEILMIFFAMTIGLATGLGYGILAVIITLIGCLLIIILTKTKIYDNNICGRKLKILIPEDLDYNEVFDEVLKKYTKSFQLMQVKTTNLGSMFELNYEIIINSDIDEKEFIDELRIRNGNLKIILTHPTDFQEF